MLSQSMEEFELLLKAKTQCIWIKTYEEEQVINDIRNIILNNFPKYKLFSWSFFSGLQKEPLTSAEQKPEPEVGVSPAGLIDKILKCELTGEKHTRNIEGRIVKDYKNKDENLWILKDFHLCNETKDILRGIRDLKERNDIIGYNPIIIISPIVNIPLEHEKLFTILDYETPDKNKIRAYFSNYVAQLNNKPGFTLPNEQQLENCINLANGLTVNELKSYVQRSLVKYKTISEEIFYQARLDMIKKTGILEYKQCNTSLDEMGGNEVFKQWVADIQESFEPEAEAFGVTKPKGYLAVGIPGKLISV